MTLGEMLAEKRKAKKISMGEIARLIDIAKPSVWKVENERNLPTGTVLKRWIHQGLGILPGSAASEEIQAQWMTQKTKLPVTVDDLSNLAKAKSRNSKDAEKLIDAILELPLEEFEAIQKTLDRPSIMEGLKGLHAIYEAASPAPRSKSKK